MLPSTLAPHFQRYPQTGEPWYRIEILWIYSPLWRQHLSRTVRLGRLCELPQTRLLDKRRDTCWMALVRSITGRARASVEFLNKSVPGSTYPFFISSVLRYSVASSVVVNGPENKTRQQQWSYQGWCWLWKSVFVFSIHTTIKGMRTGHRKNKYHFSFVTCFVH